MFTQSLKNLVLISELFPSILEYEPCHRFINDTKMNIRKGSKIECTHVYIYRFFRLSDRYACESISYPPEPMYCYYFPNNRVADAGGFNILIAEAASVIS